MGSDPNVTIAFTPSLNVVQVLTILSVVNVVQHCSGPTSGQNDMFRPKFRSRRLWRSTSQNFECRLSKLKVCMGDGTSSLGILYKIRSQIYPFWSKTYQISHFGGLRRPQTALLFNTILNVRLLLFTGPTVVLLLLLTLRTLLSSQRSATLPGTSTGGREGVCMMGQESLE